MLLLLLLPCVTFTIVFFIFISYVFIHQFVVIKDQPEGSVPALTALPRKEWACIRKEYFSEGLNRQALEAIEEALFVVRVSSVGVN